MCHDWTDVLELMCGAAFILIGNVFDAMVPPQERQAGAQELNAVLEKGLRKFPTIIRQRRFSEHYLYTQMTTIMISSFILIRIVKILLR